MPFGHNCEHSDFDSCVRTMTGKVDDPKGYCAALMRQTEHMCKERAIKPLHISHLSDSCDQS